MSIVSYHWDFGDDATSNLANPTHSYSEARNYVVTLTVTDNDGNQASDTALVTITTGGTIEIPNPPVGSTVIDETSALFSLTDPNGIFSQSTSLNVYNGSEQYAPGEDNVSENPNAYIASGSFTFTVDSLQSIELWEYHTDGNSARSAATPFEVYDNASTLIGSGTIDQSSGGDWVSLGIFYPTEPGDIVVKITNEDIDDTIGCDAIAYKLLEAVEDIPPTITTFTATGGANKVDLLLEATDTGLSETDIVVVNSKVVDGVYGAIDINVGNMGIQENDIVIIWGNQITEAAIAFDQTYTFTDIRPNTVIPGDIPPLTFRVGYRVATASEPSIYRTTFGNTDYSFVRVIVVRNVDTTTPLDSVSPLASTGEAGFVATLPAITTNSSNDVVFHLSSHNFRNPVANIITSKGSSTQVAKFLSYRLCHLATYELIPTPSTYSQGTHTYGNSGTDSWYGVSFALKRST